MKRCTSCGETKPLTEYHKAKTCKDGHNTKCKACVKEYQRLLKSDDYVVSQKNRKAPEKAAPNPGFGDETKPYDDRSVEQQLQDLGVYEPPKPTTPVTNVVWIPRFAPKRKDDLVTVRPKSINLGAKVINMLGCDRLLVGMGKMGGQDVLLFRPAPDDSKAFKVTVESRGSRRGRLDQESILKELRERNFPTGDYTMRKAKNGFVAVPADG